MIASLLKILSKIEIKENDKPSTQTGNYCYLIAGMELLFSVKDFVRFMYFSSSSFSPSFSHFSPQSGEKKKEKSKNEEENVHLKNIEKKYSLENIGPLCDLLIKYYETKNPAFYSPLQEIFYKSLYETPVEKNQDDPNLVFLFFEKSFLYTLLFSKFQYLPFSFSQNKKEEDSNSFLQSKKEGPYSIYTFLKNPGLTITEMLERCNKNGIFGAIAYCPGHYEVFKYNKKKIIAMNTDFMGSSKWYTFSIICKSHDHNCNLRVLKIIAN